MMLLEVWKCHHSSKKQCGWTPQLFFEIQWTNGLKFETIPPSSICSMFPRSLRMPPLLVIYSFFKFASVEYSQVVSFNQYYSSTRHAKGKATKLRPLCSLTKLRYLVRIKGNQGNNIVDRRLDPFINFLHLLRVEGRLRRCDEVTTESKHLIILPRTELIKLIIHHAHKKVALGGTGIPAKNSRAMVLHIFLCLASRSVYLEDTNTLETDYFLKFLRPWREIRSRFTDRSRSRK